jgi:glutamate racemase
LNHYILLKGILQRKIGNKVRIIDTTDALTAALKVFLIKNDKPDKALGKQGKYRFLVSDLTEHLLKTARHIFKRNIEFDVVVRN